jgi:hypothetical protein
MHVSEAPNTEATILSRVIQPDREPLTPEAARDLLVFHFPQRDLDRMHDLAVKNQADNLTEAEQRELEAYRRVGRLLDLLSAKARLALHQRGLSA